MDNQIKSVCARQIFDSKCRPIIEVDVITEGGVLGRGSASTGTSVGMYEAVILVDGDPNRFGRQERLPRHRQRKQHHRPGHHRYGRDGSGRH